MHGERYDATLTTDAKTLTLVPAEIAQSICIGGDQNHPVRLSLFGAKSTTLQSPMYSSMHIHFAILRARSEGGVGHGKTTHVTAQGTAKSGVWTEAFFRSAATYPTPALLRNGRCPSSHAACVPKGQTIPLTGSMRRHWACHSSKWQTLISLSVVL